MTSSFQSLWSSGDPSGLLKLAKDIETHDSWRGFLTIQEHDIFKHALDKGGQVWNDFINGNAICRIEQPSSDTSPPSGTAITSTNNRTEQSPFTNGHTPQTSSLSLPSPSSIQAEIAEEKQPELSQLDGVSVAFRVRYMLYEKSIGLMFPPSDPTISPDVDYAIFDDEQDDKPAEVPVVTRKVDDDYDDEDEDDDEDKTSSDKKPENTYDQVTDADPNGKPVILSKSTQFTYYQRHLLTL